MSQKIFTFSIPTSDHASLELVARLKKQCSKSGRSFTWVVLQALKAYEEK